MKKKKVLATALLLASAFLPLVGGGVSRLFLAERVGQPQAPSLAELRKRAEAGDAEAQYSLFLQYQEGKSPVEARAEAVGWLRKAAEAGHGTAQVSLGPLYRDGKRGDARNREQTLQWCAKSAEQGNAQGASGLGLMNE